MYYYELEYTVENLTKDLKKQKDDQDEQQGDMSPKGMMSSTQKMMKSQQSSFGKSINTPKMPKMSAPRIPKMR